MTVNGSGFGSRSTLAPIKTAFMETNTTGDIYSQAGFDFISLNWDPPNTNAAVDMSDGKAGGSFRINATQGGQEPFYHFGHSVPTGVREIFGAHWAKYDKVGSSGGGGLSQIKGFRATPSTNYGDPNVGYSGSPNFAWSAWPSTTGNGSGGWPEGRYHNNGGTEFLTGGQQAEAFGIFDANWHYFENYYKFNTGGVGDGVAIVYVDNVLAYSATNLNVSTTSASEFRQVQYNPGLANGFANIVTDVWHSRCYLDRTRQHVALGNASTAAACTGFIPLGLSHADASWSDTQIIADAPLSIPSGYDWAYVMSTSGTRNSSGLSYTVN